MDALTCQYCQCIPRLVDSAIVYGRSYGKIWYCDGCGAYVGVHEGTTKPLGTLANKTLRDMRMRAHEVFDPLWMYGGWNRKQAYNWLSQKLGIKYGDTHIGMFDEDLCRRTVDICLNHHR